MTAMPPYAVLCYTPGCGGEAAFKIAARWSDGITAELKTYSLCCANCLAMSFAEAKKRQRECPLELGETLAEPSIFERTPDSKKTLLVPRADLEA